MSAFTNRTRICVFESPSCVSLFTLFCFDQRNSAILPPFFCCAGATTLSPLSSRPTEAFASFMPAPRLPLSYTAVYLSVSIIVLGSMSPGCPPRPLNAAQRSTLEWLLRETFEPGQSSLSSFLSSAKDQSSSSSSGATAGATLLVEVGPRLSFESAVSSNVKSMCRASGIDGVTRLEVRCARAPSWGEIGNPA